MSKVMLLDENTINKIAAGEVVERPSSVVKELVENAIDAGAKRIEVETLAGGTSFIRVTDDGNGMDKEDAETAVLRHATSKIKSIEDIERSGTLGFRGEALATIAAVSHFSLLTRREGDELGTLLSIDGGKNKSVLSTGAKVGTTVKVEDLFFNTPARKKFLKTTQTEAGKINELLLKLSLAYPSISFRSLSNNKSVIATPGNGKLIDTIQSLYGKELTDALLSLSFESEDIKLEGFVSKPSMIRSSRSWQTLIVNGRVVGNKAVNKAIENAYHSLLPKSGYPFALISLTVPPASIDVNVHPQKAEIKFSDEGAVFKAIYKAVVEAVRSVGDNLAAVAANVQNAERHYTTLGEGRSVSEMTLPLGAVKSQTTYPRKAEEPFGFVAEGGIDFVEARRIISGEKSVQPTISSYQPSLTELPSTDGEEIKPELSALVPLGQVGVCYIVAKDENGLYIVDQHAAHERIMYDRFAAQAQSIATQPLLVQPILSFGESEANLIEEHEALFAELGFETAMSGENEIRLLSVPVDIPVSEAQEVMREILSRLEGSPHVTSAQIRHACIATMACRAAIKANEELNLKQMQIILTELSKTTLPYTCPHGRPTILRFAVDELAKMFKRT